MTVRTVVTRACVAGCGRVFIWLFVGLLLTSCAAPGQWDQKTHVVRSGETLFTIAFRYGEDHQALARWNNLGDGSLIYPGQVLRLTPPSGTGRTRTPVPVVRNSPPAKKSLPPPPSDPPPGWSWPTSGRIHSEFDGKPGSGTGLVINGKAGQAVRAAAEGRVVYSGGGLIGYGQLLIIKHNDTYLSAYGYNASLLVKEGEKIRKGQRIAIMGEGPADRAQLHFEIRRNGKPVNPRQYLPKQ